MKVSNHRIFLVAAGAIIFALAGAGSVRSQDKPANPKPTFKVLDLDGQMNDLGELRGNVVLISFGATWCPPCITELRALEQVLKGYAGKPVKFFWVSIESAEEVTDAELRRYAKKQNLSFPVMRDSSQAVFLQFSPRIRLPMVVMLAKDGHVVHPVQFGLRSPVEAYKSDIRARLDKLLTVRSESDR